MKLEHFGIAVKSLESSVPLFEKIFNVKAGEKEFVAEQKVNVRKINLKTLILNFLKQLRPTLRLENLWKKEEREFIIVHSKYPTLQVNSKN